jgi:hypothetical protein
MTWEKLATPIIVGIVLFALFRLFLATKHRVMEAFGYSEGTMVQLSSSHVPTMEVCRFNCPEAPDSAGPYRYDRFSLTPEPELVFSILYKDGEDS